MARRSKTRTHLPNGLLCSYPDGWAPHSNLSLRNSSPGSSRSEFFRTLGSLDFEWMTLRSRYVPEEVRVNA